MQFGMVVQGRLMKKIKKLMLDKLLSIYLIVFGNHSLSIFNLVITIVLLSLFFLLLIKNEIRATFYQAIVVFRAIGMSLICFSTSVTLLTSKTDVHWLIIGMIAFASLLGLLFQLPYYTDVLKAALPELKRKGKVQIQSRLWDIRVKTTYDMGKVESKVNALMKQLSFLTYLAPGIGMLVSRNLDISGDILFQAIIFMYLSILFLLGAALPIGEYWLIKEINKTENIVLKI